MKKILIVTGIFPPDIGGPATYVSNLVKDLPKYKFKVNILTLGNKASTKNIKYISKKYSFFKRLLKIKEFIEKNEFDVIYAQDPFSVGFGVAIAKTSAKKVLKIVGDNVWEISRDILNVEDSIEKFQKKKYGLKINMMKRIQKYTAKKFDKIVTPSKFLKKIVQDWGIKSNKIEVIYNAVRIQKESLVNKSIVKKKLRLKGRNFVTVARLTPWKGIALLIEIFKERKENLIIIGNGPLYEKYKKQTNGLKNIKMLGRLPNKNVHEYLYAADTFILNSGYEGLPHVVIEAFNLECPVLLSNVCGNPEIVKNNYNGLLFKYNNRKSIVKTLDTLNERKIKRFTSNAKDSLKKFEWNNMVKKIAEVLS